MKKEQEKYSWRFPILDGGRKQGINDSGVATFSGVNLYQNLAREICQNSLDAYNENNTPVLVTFVLLEENLNSFSPANSLKRSIDSCEEFWKESKDVKIEEFISSAKEVFNNENISIMKISDYNTKGLSGAGDENGTWDALIGSVGTSNKNEDSQGSYGIGKSAPFACSDLRTVFYNTYSIKDEKKAFQGVALLATHLNENDEKTQACGYFQNTYKKTAIFNNDDCPLNSFFERCDYGTDIYILAFKTLANWEEIMKKAIVVNFLPAIIDGKLEVKINNILINRKSIHEIITELSFSDKSREIQIAHNLYKLYTNKEVRKLTYKILEPNDLEVYIDIDKKFLMNISYFRQSGMLIQKKSKRKFKPFEVLVIAKGNELNKVLKTIEPPKHDCWDCAILQDSKKKEHAKVVLNDLEKCVINAIDEICKSDDTIELDPNGVAEFLPDEMEFCEGEDTKEIVHYSDDFVIRTKSGSKRASSINKTGSRKGKGKKSDESLQHKGHDNNHHKKISVVVGGGDDDGVRMLDDGGKILNFHLKNMRILPINAKIGMYRLNLESYEDLNDINIRIKIKGESGIAEPLKIVGYHNENEKFVKINDESIKGLCLAANKMNVLDVKVELNIRGLIYVEVLKYE